jgi:hypothetical protein
VSERQKRGKGYLSPGFAGKVTPAWMKGAALSSLPFKAKHGIILPRIGMLEALRLQPKK